LEPSAVDRDEEGEPPVAERVEVLLALAIDAPGPATSCPPLEDIAAWYDGRLPRAEVPSIRTHVARCRRCYAAWWALVEAAGVAGPARVTLRDAGRRLLSACGRGLARPRTWGLTAAAAAAAGVAVLYFGAWGAPGWIDTINDGYRNLSTAVARSAPAAARWTWGAGLASRGLRATPDGAAHAGTHETARAAFSAGVRTGLDETVGTASAWMPVLAALPAEPLPCTHASTPAGCEERNAVFHEVGRWATLVHFACTLEREPAQGAAPPDAAFWRAQSRVIGEAGRAIDAALPDDPFARFFADWRAEARASDDPRSLLCAREASLLSLGLD
jgi:hypothetical protein